MAHVDEVVDLDAAADAGFSQRPAVDGGVGADFDFVLDDQRSLLRELSVGAGGGVAHVAEAVRAEHRAGVYDHPVTERGAGVKYGAGVDVAVVANADTAADDGACLNARARADAGVVLNDGAWADCDVVAELDVRADDGGGMNAGDRQRSLEQLAGTREPEARLGSLDDDAIRGIRDAEAGLEGRPRRLCLKAFLPRIERPRRRLNRLRRPGWAR